MTVEAPDGPALREVDLSIEGMTCASCATRIERRLNKLDGVTATVNYATEQARVEVPEGIEDGRLVAEVEAAGYHAHLPAPVGEIASTDPTDPTDPTQPSAAAKRNDAATLALRDRLRVSVALTVPVLLMSMVPALQFPRWQWLALTLAAPVVVWGALPFHRAAWTNLRHGA